jgi:DNA-binding transcriptional MocR family regulator
MSLSRGARACLKTLQSYLGGKNYCWPSQYTLAEDLKCSRRSVIRYIKELRAAKLVTSGRSNRNTSNTYTLQPSLSLRVSHRPVTLNKNLIEPEVRRPPQTEKRTEGRRRVWEFDDCDPAELQRFIDEHERRRQA